MQTAVLKKWLLACAITLLGVFQLSSTALAQLTTSQLGGGISINEILVDPNGPPDYDTDGNGTAETEDEFIELYNSSAAPIDISGYQLWRPAPDLVWFTFPAGSIVPAGGYAVVITKVQAGGALPVVAGSLFFDAGHTGGILSNGPSNVVLLNPATNEYIQASYNGSAVDPTDPAANYTGFPAATLVGAVDDFGTYSPGISTTRSPSGTTTIDLHTDVSSDPASPGGGGATAAVAGNIIVFDFNDDDDIADGGLPANLTKTISREPAFAGAYNYFGGASGSAMSTAAWDNGNGTKYYVIEFTTNGYENITVESKQKGSNTGPKDFKVQYSLDNVAWIDVPSSTITVDNDSFVSGVLPTTAVPTAVDNQASVYLRWIMTSDIRVNVPGTVASTGNDRIDDIVVKGTPIVTPSTLFFSEYVEGSGQNKALEIYNPTASAVNLATDTYTVEIYTNGSSTPTTTIALTGTISSQGTYVIVHNDGATSGTLIALSNQIGSLGFNGDDAIVLKDNGTIIDVIGQIGADPGTQWSSGGISTLNRTLRRKCAIAIGDDDGSDAFDPSVEWDGFAVDIFDGLGAHCPTSTINVTGTPLTAFTTTALNVASATQTYEVNGTSLTVDITITAPAEFEVSLDGITFTSSVTIPFATANAAGTTTVYVRYLPTSGTSHTGDVANASTGASTVNVAVTGTVPPSLMTIAIARTRPVNEIVTITGTLTAATQFGGPAFIQDATGGIAVFDTQIHGGAFQIGDTLTLTAKRVDYQNQIQLSNVTAFTDLGVATVPVVPEVITLDQLDAYRGELVKIVSVTFPDPNTFLFGNSNYSVTNGVNSGDVRIDGDTDLAGRSQPTVCDVTGVVAYFQTASQLIPRFQADLPCTNPYVSPSSSTVTACIDLPKTLEVSTYNVEWFGFAQGGTPSGNTSPAAQKAAVKAVIGAQNSDIYFLEEINNTDLMGQIAAELTASTPDTWDTLFSYYTSYAATSPIAETQKVGFLYKSNIITPQFSYAMHSSIHPYYNGGIIDPALAAYPEADKTRFWASGRLPFMMNANVMLNGGSEEVNFIVLHSRSGSAQDKYDMRRFDVTLLQDSISAWLGSEKVIMGGDYNDDVDESIYEVAGVPQTTSYDAFTTRPTEYTILSKDLSDNDFRSTVGFSDMIDHLTVSNELANGYIPNSVSVGYEYYDGSYEYTTSDHFIVSARLEIVPIASCDFTATANSSSQITLNWTDSTNIENSYVVEFSLDGLTGWTAITGSPFVANSITGIVTGLTANTQYFFRVRAEETATNFSPWVFANATTLTAPIGGGGGATTPTVTRPIDFRAVAVSTSQINLTWTAVSGATGYILYRGRTVVATLGNVTSFEDTGLMSDTFYSYRLVATNGGRQSDPASANARTFPAAPSLLSVTNACSGGSAIIKVSSTGALYYFYVDSTSTGFLFETTIATIVTPVITETTTFYVSVVSNGRESERTPITVIVNPLPLANIIEDRIVSCETTSTITAEEVAGASYTWIINGSVIETTITPTYQVNRSGNYQVRVNLNTCSAISDVTPVRLNYVPIAQIAQGVIVRSCESSTIISAANSNQNDSTVVYEWTRNNVVLGNTASISVSESGTYQLRATQFGCSATDEIVVEISTIDRNVSFSASQTTICPNEEITLTVDNPQQNVLYTWVRNGRVLRTTRGAEHITSIAGEYRVLASQNSCSVLSAPIDINRIAVEPVYLRKVDYVLSVESITPITNVVWLFEGEEETSFAGQMSITPDVAGYYSARVTFDTGCEGFTRTVYYSPRPPVVTGEEEIIDVETIVYPNPSKTGVFRIQLSNSITSDVTFTVTDNIGRVLENKTIKANEVSTLQTLDLSQYAAGMYALTIETKQGTVIKKIIIE